MFRKFLEYEETFQGSVLLHQTLNSRGNVNVFLVPSMKSNWKSDIRVFEWEILDFEI